MIQGKFQTIHYEAMSVSSRRSQSGLLQATSCRMMEKTGLPGIKISSFWFLHVTISLLHSWHHSLPTFFWWFSLCWLLWQPMNLMEKVIHISLFPPSRSYVAKEISWWDAGARGLCSYSSSGRQRVLKISTCPSRENRRNPAVLTWQIRESC